MRISAESITVGKQFCGKRMRDARLSVPLHQWQLGQMIDRCQSSVSQYESGVFDPPRHVVARIAGALGVAPAHLYVSAAADRDRPESAA